jgi:hypothetical protein
MGVLWMGSMLKNKFMEKKIFVIDGYRIWAFTYEEAYESYLRILNF